MNADDTVKNLSGSTGHPSLRLPASFQTDLYKSCRPPELRLALDTPHPACSTLPVHESLRIHREPGNRWCPLFRGTPLVFSCTFLSVKEMGKCLKYLRRSFRVRHADNWGAIGSFILRGNSDESMFPDFLLPWTEGRGYLVARGKTGCPEGQGKRVPVSGLTLGKAVCNEAHFSSSVSAIMAHFFFLAAFFWLNTMCFNIWWTFR